MYVCQCLPVYSQVLQNEDSKQFDLDSILSPAWNAENAVVSSSNPSSKREVYKIAGFFSHILQIHRGTNYTPSVSAFTFVLKVKLINCWETPKEN